MSTSPKGWTSVPLDAICSPAEQCEPTQDFTYIDIGSIDRSRKRIVAPQRLSVAEAPSRARKLVKVGDTLVSMTRPNLNAVALVPPELDGQVASTGFEVLRANGLDPRWISYLVRTDQFVSAMTSLVQGALYPAVRSKDVRAFQAPVAPLAEQRRIADKLDTVLARVDSVNDRLARVAPLLKRFRQSVLAAAYTGKLTQELRAAGGMSSVVDAVQSLGALPRPNRYNSRTDAVISGDYALAVNDAGMPAPEGWRWVAMVDVARMESGHTPSRSVPGYWGGEVPWIGIADARIHHAGTINETLQHTNAFGLANSAARLLPAGTVCVSRTASVGYVVKMGQPMATSQDFVNWTCTPAVNPDWLKWLFVAESEALPRFGKGSTHTTIYFPEWLSLHVALPPIEEQVEIVRRVDLLMKYADRLEARLQAAQTAAERLTPALLAKAFRGELVPQDPNDEPASELLKRLATARDGEGAKRVGRKRKADTELS